MFVSCGYSVQLPILIHCLVILSSNINCLGFFFPAPPAILVSFDGDLASMLFWFLGF